jgi:isopentenyl diphosphate isomerase/L-lactate dehydrogenase-like FMN-dependent dehydrogenase
MEAEMRVAMTLTGVSKVEAITSEILADPALRSLSSASS